MNTSKVLNEAADLIERDGWWSQNPNAPRGGVRPQCASNAISDVSTDILAQYAFSTYLTGECSLSAIWDWNDADDRDGTQVVEALRAAALIEAARESQETAWATYAEVVTA
jgi:hypothetical protein